MVTGLEILNEQLKTKSLGQISRETKISKPTLSLMKKGTYSNPEKMYKRLEEQYGEGQEIIGVTVGSVSEFEDLVDLMKDIECL